MSETIPCGHGSIVTKSQAMNGYAYAEENVLEYPAQDAEALKDQINRLFEDEELRGFRQGASEFIHLALVAQPDSSVDTKRGTGGKINVYHKWPGQPDEHCKRFLNYTTSLASVVWQQSVRNSHSCGTDSGFAATHREPGGISRCAGAAHPPACRGCGLHQIRLRG